MKPPQLHQLTIRRLHQSLSERIFAIPKLQREFIWDGRKAAALLDSISKGMPIGIFLIWQTKSQNYDLLRQSLNILPSFNTENHFVWFMIDGQQRLSVLYQAFIGDQMENSNGQIVDFGKICYIINPDPEEEDPQHFTYRKPISREYLPVRDILASNWKWRFKGYPQHLLKRIRNCRERLLKYRVPLVIIHSNDLEEIREVFIRINSQGMKISTADRAFAKASKVDLRELAHVLRAGINPKFHDIDFNIILQGFAFTTREREVDVGQRSLEATIKWWEKEIDNNGKQSAFYKHWNQYRTAFGQAVDYLHMNFNVLHSSFLPSVNMLATLSVFFYYHPAAPDTKRRKEIRKWFWATSVGVRYSGRGYRQNLIEDVRFFERLAKTSHTRFTFSDRMDPADVSRAEYIQRSALTNAFFCLLACQQPRYLANGQQIPLTVFASQANRSDRHHIFPKQMLANYGFTHRDFNSLCNICFIVSRENQEFGMKRPDSYLKEYSKKRHFARTMRSHLIPYKDESGLWTRDVRKAYVIFLRRRLIEICRAFEKQAGIKLFRKI
ncbi:MAG: DUF262 domain-containing protein [Thermoguttaceae bacterium]